jgi:hypothetical protein
VGRITKGSGSLYTAVPAAVQANLSKAFLNPFAKANQEIPEVVFPGGVDMPTYDLAGAPDFFCDNGLPPP